MDCVFCKIIAGKIPSSKVYEDKTIFAFLDIAPVNPGHTLIVPKAHYPDFLSTPPELAAQMLTVLQRIAPAVLKATKAPAFNVGINNGRAAGQLVDHVHIHLMPRQKGDGLKSWKNGSYAPGEAYQLAQQIAVLVRA